MIESITAPIAHYIFKYTGYVVLALAIPLFIVTVVMDPGNLKPVFNYNDLCEEAIELGLDMTNLCSYCKVIKSETSFHCTICNQCVEAFDHHCPFVNGCLGYRNHKYFFIFVVLYSIYLTTVLAETIRHFSEMFKAMGWACLETDSVATVLIILILLHMPILYY